MNILFLPNELESELIQIIQKYCRNEFALIRMTPTMLKKSIIDASEEIRVILRDNNIVDYRRLNKGIGFKQLRRSFVISPLGISENQTSFYRPETKEGDPRFWVSVLGRHTSPHTLVYFTTFEGQLVAIPLIDYSKFEDNLLDLFGDNDEEEKIVEDFKRKISVIKNKGWVKSVSPFKLNDKDIGETLEKELGVEINNLPTPDFQGEIEVKGKTLGSNTKDSLFSMVPNWNISLVKSSNEMALLCGYPDNDYEGYKALFVEVGMYPNNQGLFLAVDEENELIHQNWINNDEITIVCSWGFEEVKRKLYAKHPKTMWIVAEKRVINGEIHFKYNKVQYTNNPIFAQFITLIQQGLITFNWRRRADIGAFTKLPNSKMDYGHGFRLDSKKRHLLFGETIDLDL